VGDGEVSAGEVRPLAEWYAEQIANAVRPIIEAARRSVPDFDEVVDDHTEDEFEPSTVYTASVTSPGGITFTASIVVPESAAYPDQLELTETAQMAVASMASGFKRSEDIRAGLVPF
jgi:hypothetical protein